MDQVNDALQKEVTSVDKEDKSISKWIGSIQPNGSWKDIDYSKKDITIWQPIDHLSRLKDLAIAFTNNNSSYYNSISLYQSILLGLRFWYQQDPQSKNWWHNEIDAPQHLGELLIILRHNATHLPVTLEDSLIERMKRGDMYKQTGANKLDVATHNIYRAALKADTSLMSSAVEQAFQPISFTNQEGLQYDYSFMQHGKQLQISSYGSVFLHGEFKVASILKGTPYALSGDKLTILSKYCLNTYLKAIRGGYSDFNIEGRGISRVNALNKTHEVNFLKGLSLLDSSNSGLYNAAIARLSGIQLSSYLIIPSHTFFYCADYTLHTQPDYSFNVRMVSTTTKRTECGNGENLIGKFLPDGATDIQVRGDEYYNIMPLWEWDKIPGTTARDYVEDQPTTARWGEVGSTTFVGGVSDSSYGASVYDMDYNAVTAKKSWFFFDKEVVCLGAGINCSAIENVTTTINQCWLRGDVEVQGKKIKGNSVTGYDNPSWIIHDGIGYFFPEKEKVFVSNKEQKGDWYHINNSTPKTKITGDVFKIWIYHGVNPSNAHYAYIVVPDAKNNSLEAVNAAVKIIANTEQLQVVRNEALDITEAVLYKPGSFSVAGYSIKSDKACVLMLRDMGKAKKKLYVADPTQLQTQGKITITNDNTHSSKDYSFHFPTGNRAGASQLVELE